MSNFSFSSTVIDADEMIQAPNSFDFTDYTAFNINPNPDLKIYDLGAFICKMQYTEKKPAEEYGFRTAARHKKEYLQNAAQKYGRFLLLFPWTLKLGVVDIDEWEDEMDVANFIAMYPPLFRLDSKSGKPHLYYPAREPHKGAAKRWIKGVKADFICQSLYVGLYDCIDRYYDLIKDWIDHEIKPDNTITYEALLESLYLDLPEHKDPQPEAFQDKYKTKLSWPAHLETVEQDGEIIGWHNTIVPHLGFINRHEPRSNLVEWVRNAKRGHRAKTISAALYNLGYQTQDYCIYEDMLADSIKEHVQEVLINFVDEINPLIDRSESPYTDKELERELGRVIPELNNKLGIRLKNYKSHINKMVQRRKAWALRDSGMTQKAVAQEMGVSVKTIKRYDKER